jgi:hypothetical protein
MPLLIEVGSKMGTNFRAVFAMRVGYKVNGISTANLSGDSPEKAGVGGSIPSLATIIQRTYDFTLRVWRSGKRD